MSYPSSNKEIEFNNIALEKLDSMSTAELLDLLENLNDTMTEDNFNDELVTACLDALDRKSPMPAYMTEEESWRSFENKVGLEDSGSIASTSVNRAGRKVKRVFRTGLVAAIIVFCLFSCMIVAQAAGVDVFGSIARWTDSVFGFEPDAEKTAQKVVPGSFEECMELLAPKVPEGFVMTEPIIFQDYATGYKEGGIDYYNDADYITLTIIEAPDGNGSIYEKDDNEVEVIDIGSFRFYVFSNNGDSVAAWRYHQYECGINTSLDRDVLISILHDSYADGV